MPADAKGEWEILTKKLEAYQAWHAELIKTLRALDLEWVLTGMGAPRPGAESEATPRSSTHGDA
jgi:hypothetical protein